MDTNATALAMTAAGLLLGLGITGRVCAFPAKVVFAFCLTVQQQELLLMVAGIALQQQQGMVS